MTQATAAYFDPLHHAAVLAALYKVMRSGAYHALPREVRQVADKNFALLKANPAHSSLRLKKAGKYWSVRVGSHYRALATERAEGLVWFWIGLHAVYDTLLH